MKKEDILADEVLMIREGGEMPEVAFNSSLYYLTEDEEGPQLQLNEADILILKQAVVQRFRIIILRDLLPENREKTIYRGVERSCVNWFRMVGYCQKEALESADMRVEVAEALGAFLQVVLREADDQHPPPGLNCTCDRLQQYAQALGVDLDGVVQGWRRLVG